MGARLRRSGKAGVVSLMVAIALIGSAWLAYATTAPKGNTVYPVTAIRIKGKGFCGNKKNDSRFQFDVARKPNGQLRGSMHTEIGQPAVSFGGRQLTSLNVSGNTANFSINGNLNGHGVHDHTLYTADVTVTDGHPDTWSVKVHSGSHVIYQNACPVSGGFIDFQKNS